jgi:hypothetical protein
MVTPLHASRLPVVFMTLLRITNRPPIELSYGLRTVCALSTKVLPSTVPLP